MKIRFAFIDDFPAIISIYNEAIVAGGATGDLSPLTIADKEGWFNDHSQSDYPIYILEINDIVIGWGALSPYRKGRMALRKTAELSYYLSYNFHGKGYGKKLIDYILNDCKRLSINNILAILLEVNDASIAILEKSGFKRWGYLPKVADLNGKICGQYIYGTNLNF